VSTIRKIRITRTIIRYVGEQAPATAVVQTPAKHKKKLKPLPSIQLGRWRHKEKGMQVRIMDVVRIEHDCSPGVAYRHIRGNQDTWVRPFTQFLERFQFLGKD